MSLVKKTSFYFLDLDHTCICELYREAPKGFLFHPLSMPKDNFSILNAVKCNLKELTTRSASVPVVDSGV